jgi:hypothetical protein
VAQQQQQQQQEVEIQTAESDNNISSSNQTITTASNAAEGLQRSNSSGSIIVSKTSKGSTAQPQLPSDEFLLPSANFTVDSTAAN